MLRFGGRVLRSRGRVLRLQGPVLRPWERVLRFREPVLRVPDVGEDEETQRGRMKRLTFESVEA
ncbi:hypothetical protein ACZ91_28675 [Streptomyces regensis]|nr:hypothetical protein ACZ91_28675 [Streptomyces regensis]